MYPCIWIIITLEVITDKAVMILTHNDNIISFDHSSIGICDKYTGHMITTDKKCAMLELLLISKSSKTLKIILENDSAEHYKRL